jgi:hypothetical protein
LQTARRGAGRAIPTRLGDWYGNLIRMGKRHVLLFISERATLRDVLRKNSRRRAVQTVIRGDHHRRSFDSRALRAAATTMS